MDSRIKGYYRDIKYYPYGSIMCSNEYFNETRHGEWRSYGYDGLLRYIIHYRHGLKYGFWFWVDIDVRHYYLNLV